jgi:IS6 family transposase
VHAFVLNLRRRGLFVQNLRRGHYELATDTPTRLQLATVFTELALAI